MADLDLGKIPRRREKKKEEKEKRLYINKGEVLTD